MEYQLTADNFAAGNRLHHSARRTLLLRPLAWSLIFSTVLFITIDDKKIAFPAFLISLPVAYAVAYALLHLILWLVMPWRARRLYRNYPMAHRMTRLALSQKALHAQNEQGEVLYPWSDFIRWRANEKVVLTYLAPNLFLIIPNRLADVGFPIESLKAVLARELGPPRR